METTEDVQQEQREDNAHQVGHRVVREAGGEPPVVPSREQDDELQSAAEYLLGAFSDPPTIEHTIRINVGGVNDKKWVRWTIRALPGELVRRIREDAEALVRRAGSTGAGSTSASFTAATRYVIEASVDPDIKALAKQAGLANPADLLEEALHSKQGLIEQISGQVLALSGYDNDDVQDALEVRAAGNF